MLVSNEQEALLLDPDHLDNLPYVPKLALKTPFRQGTVQDLAKVMLRLSKDGLRRRGIMQRIILFIVEF